MATNIELVQQLYVAYFNRPADVAGLNFWVDALAKGETTETIAAAFATQKEYTDLFAGKSVDSIIDTVYMNMFGRHAEQAALDWYGPKVQAGIITIDNVVTDILSGAQGTDADAYNNKVTAAAAFTEALATPGNEADRVAYSSGDTSVLNVAKAWLATVTTDASLTTALGNVESTVDQLTAVVTPSKTLYASQGLDTLAGGAGNDKFYALAFNSVSGADVTTLNSVDSLDGSAGEDSLFIEVKDAGATNYNGTIAGTITNIEHITIDNTAADTAALVTIDASKFVGATDITQVGQAADVSTLAAGTIAGFKGATVTAASDLDVDAAGSAATVAIKVDGLKGAAATAGAEVQNRAVINTSGAVLNAVTVTGTLAQTTTTAGASAASLGLAVVIGEDEETFTLNTAVRTTLTIDDSASTDKVTTVDASGSAGRVTFAGDTDVVTIKGGSGIDTLTLDTTTAAASGATAAVNGLVDGGAGNDNITVTADGTGAVTVNGGAGNDTVAITTRASGVLTVNLGEGDDVFTSAAAINATDVIDAGAGADKLLLNLVGSANVGAFSNFDSFDAISLAKTLDVDILATKNTVTEFVTTGDVGVGATLTNIGAGVGYRVMADTAIANGITLTQKTAGDITLTMDIDESADATTVSTNADAAVTTNATGVKVVFDADFADEAASATDNVAAMTVTATAAKTVTVESGGDNAANELTFGAGATALTTVTVTGAAKATLSGFSGAVKLATIDASAATGGLVAATALVDTTTAGSGGVIKLGSGADVITVTASANALIESIVGFEKAAAAAVGTDATAKAAAIADTDILTIAGGEVANASTSALAATLSKGVLTFTGAGPATLDAAIIIADDFAETLGESVAFQYLGDTYVFAQGATHAVGAGGTVAANDIVVKLTGITGVTNFVEDTGTASNFFIV